MSEWDGTFRAEVVDFGRHGKWIEVRICSDSCVLLRRRSVEKLVAILESALIKLGSANEQPPTGTSVNAGERTA